MKNNRKKRMRTVLLPVILCIILMGGLAAYKNKDLLINYYNLHTKSPAKYYTYLEQYGLYRLQSYASKEKTDHKKTYAYDISSNISFHQKELDAALETVLGTNLTDLENILGISIQNLSLDLLLASNEYHFNKTVDINLNDTKLISAQILFDALTRKLSLRFPDLSEAYLTHSFGNNDPSPKIHQEKLSVLIKERMERIARRYMDLYFNHLGTVTLNKKQPLSLTSITTECNQLTISFTPEESMQFLNVLIDTAKNDPDILTLLPQLSITKEQYQRALERLEVFIAKQLEEYPGTLPLQMKLYVDSSGHILGRELICFGAPILRYTFLKNKHYEEYAVSLSHAATNHSLRINGKNRRLEGANQGSLTILLEAPTLNPSSEMNLDINYEKLRSYILEGRRFIEGSLTLSTEKLGGLQITSDFYTDKDTQHNTTAIRLGASALITVTSTGAFPTNYQVSLPENQSNRFDSSQYEEFLSTMEFESYLRTQSKALGIDYDNLMKLLNHDPTGSSILPPKSE